MPTKREREYYAMGFADGYKSFGDMTSGIGLIERKERGTRSLGSTKPKRKPSAWNKFVKVNSKKPRFRYKSGAKRGKVNLKALGIAYRKKKR